MIIAQRAGAEMNEGRSIWWMDYGRAVPLASVLAKCIDSFFPLFAWTNLELARYSELDPPNSYLDNFNLLQEARQIGAITEEEFRNAASQKLLNGDNLNFAALSFLRRVCPELVPDAVYRRHIRRLRWGRDHYVYRLDRGLMDEVKRFVPEHEYKWQILRYCEDEQDGMKVKPIPIALKAAYEATYIGRHEYNVKLKALLAHFKRLQREDVEGTYLETELALSELDSSLRKLDSSK